MADTNNTQLWVKSPIIIKDACGKLQQDTVPTVKKTILKHLGYAHASANTQNSRWSNLINGRKAVSPAEKNFIRELFTHYNITTSWDGNHLRVDSC